jgi:hypothetical protein
VKLFLAAQYKVEKQVSALTQIQNDVLRETATAARRLPKVSFVENGVTQQGFRTDADADRQDQPPLACALQQAGQPIGESDPGCAAAHASMRQPSYERFGDLLRCR